jgi:hypothetical protein
MTIHGSVQTEKMPQVLGELDSERHRKSLVGKGGGSHGEESMHRVGRKL